MEELKGNVLYVWTIFRNKALLRGEQEIAYYKNLGVTHLYVFLRHL